MLNGQSALLCAGSGVVTTASIAPNRSKFIMEANCVCMGGHFL